MGEGGGNPSPPFYIMVWLRRASGANRNVYWVFSVVCDIGRTDAEAEAPILWAPDGKN